MTEGRFTATAIRQIAEKAAVTASDQFSGVAEKTNLNNDDRLMIEDAEDGFTKKYVKKSNLPGGSSGIPSNPTQGNFTVTNLYVDAATGTLVVVYDDTPEP